MRSLAETQARWQATMKVSGSLSELQSAVRYNGSSSPCLSGCRSVCWKIFLLSRAEAESTWSQLLRQGRERYIERSDHFLKFIRHPESLAELTVDPLADDPQSPWNTVREDELIRAEILQDVQRLPDEANYHENWIQMTILDILFIYCKLNPDRGGYRQGMHELLAPIVHVIQQDALDPTKASTEEPLDELLLETLDSSYIEHDAFLLFSELMEHAQSFYELKPAPNPPADGSSNQFPEQSSAIVERSKFIHEVCLQKLDPELEAHLTNIEILPQIFLIRWIRLLFSREFPFNQFLVFWDTIFAIDPSIELIDLICCSMLLRIRWQLLESDYSVCLQLLLKYPPPDPLHGPQTFVDDAVYLRDHMNRAGGASLIMKYSGKVPTTSKSPDLIETATSPFGGFNAARRKGFGMRSPLRSAKFLNQATGVENMIQGVLERGEKLGINQAVRDAMGEIKRNVQGLNEAARNSPQYYRSSLTYEGEAKALAAMERRNQQLAGLLDETVANLKTVSISSLEDKAKSLELIEIAAAKVQFVQIYLQDSSMEMPAMSNRDVEETRSPASKKGKDFVKEPAVNKENEPISSPRLSEANVSILSLGDDTPSALDGKPVAKEPSPAKDNDGGVIKTDSILSKTPPPQVRPAAPIPARSTIAQSSFSWMLEPDESGPPQTPPARKSPNTNPKRRGPNNASREKNAFLFGDDAVEVDGRDPLGSGDTIFGLEPLQKAREL